MPPRAVPVTLTAAERKMLNKRARGAKTPHRDRVRARIVLAAACGRPNARIAAGLGITVDMVRKWRSRFAVHALACQLPAGSGVPLARWTGPELPAEITTQAAGPLSLTSLRRILAGHPVKPWQYRSWIYPRAADFEARAAVILDLYQGCYQGKRLRPGDRILSFDAKPQIQARRRRHAALPAAPGKPVRVEHEYTRHGALAVLAGMDVHTGTVFASTPATTGITPFMDLAGQVMGRPEYKPKFR
jgi:Homeodomain-like domain-containing protein